MLELNYRDEEVMLLLLHYEELLSLQDLFSELENRNNLSMFITT